jgi:hypothetical protein
MWIGAKTGESSSAMQERLAQAYGRAMQAEQAPRIATTDIDGTDRTADPSWAEALSRAMAKSNALVEAQANIQQREADISQREQQVAQRERALQAERSRLQTALLFPGLKIA